MRFILLILLYMISNSLQSQSKATVIYVGDPMCSWCYGFSEEFSSTIETLGEQVDFQIVMGGLRPYNKESMVDLKDFLQEHWQEVSHRSGQKFHYDILDRKDIMYDTEPSCRAVVTFRQLNPESTLAYFKQVQKSFYHHNNHPLETVTFSKLATEFGVDAEKFSALFESEEMKQAVKRDFSVAQSMNARSFPSVLVKKEDQYYLVAQGYTTADILLERIHSIIEK